MLYTHLNGDFFYGLYIENGAIQKILMPQRGLVERDPDPYWWIHLNEVVIIAHAFDLGGLGYGSINIIIGGGNGNWWGNGPIDEPHNNGGGFTPPICADGSLMGPEGKCFCPDGSDMPASGECVAGPVDTTGGLCNCINLSYKRRIGSLFLELGFGKLDFFMNLYEMDCNVPSTEGYVGVEINDNYLPFTWEMTNQHVYIGNVIDEIPSPNCGYFVKVICHGEIQATWFPVGGWELLSRTYSIDSEQTVPFY